MLMKKNIVLFACVIAGLILAACGQQATPTQSSNDRITQVALTVQAELTRVVALTPSATPTLPPTATSTPEPATATATIVVATATATKPAVVAVTQSPDNLAYVADVSVPDNSILSKNKAFTKTWKVSNSGTTTWIAGKYKLIYVDGTLLGDVKEVVLGMDVAPGKEIDISVEMKTPGTSGDYISYWKMVNADGRVFGEPLSVKIHVSDN
jgi:hypothetical protein